MSNNLFNQYGRNNQSNNMIQQFINFKNSFQGNPKEEVEKIIRSGRFSQDQINQVQNMARQFQSLLNR